MEYKIETLKNFKIIGYQKDFKADQAFTLIPQFFNQMITKINHNHMPGNGIFSVTMNDPDDFNLLHYFVGGIYEHDIPGMVSFEFSNGLWVKFPCTGPYPYALQNLNYEIYNKWFPEHQEYTLASDISIEFLSNGHRQDPDYYSELWLPIRQTAYA